jgi:hypothetical protein
MQDWFRFPKRVRPGWQYRIAFLIVGIWFVAYLLNGPEIFGIGGLVGFGAVVLLGIGGFALWYCDPRTGKRRAKRIRTVRGST